MKKIILLAFFSLLLTGNANADAVVNKGMAKYTSFIVTELAFQNNIYGHNYQATIFTEYITKENLDKIAVIVSFRPEAKYGWTMLPYTDGPNILNVTYSAGQILVTCTVAISKRDFKVVIIENK